MCQSALSWHFDVYWLIRLSVKVWAVVKGKFEQSLRESKIILSKQGVWGNQVGISGVLLYIVYMSSSFSNFPR